MELGRDQGQLSATRPRRKVGAVTLDTATPQPLLTMVIIKDWLLYPILACRARVVSTETPPAKLYDRLADARTVPRRRHRDASRSPGESRTARGRRENAAKKLCAQCPVIRSCRDYALDAVEAYGVWGGRNNGEGAQAPSSPALKVQPAKVGPGVPSLRRSSGSARTSMGRKSPVERSCRLGHIGAGTGSVTRGVGSCCTHWW